MKVSASIAMHSNLSTPVAGSAPKKPAPADGSGPKVSISPQGRALSTQAASQPDGMALTELMAGVSLRHIRYTDLVAVADRLRDAGYLAEQDYLDFIGPSPEFAKIDGSTTPDWNAPKDVIGAHETNLAFLISSGADQRSIDFEKHMLSLFHAFEP